MKTKLIALDQPVLQTLGLIDKLRINLNIQHAKLFHLGSDTLVADFIALPEKLRTADVAKAYMDMISFSSVADIYKAVDDRKKTAALTEYALIRAGNVKDILPLIPDRLKPDIMLHSQPGYKKPEYRADLYSFFPEFMKTQAITDLALLKSDYWNISDVYIAMPDSQKTASITLKALNSRNPDAVSRAIPEKLIPEVIAIAKPADKIGIYLELPVEMKTKAITDYLISSLDNQQKAQIYLSIPREFITPEITREVLQARLDFPTIISIYNSIPEEDKPTFKNNIILNFASNLKDMKKTESYVSGSHIEPGYMKDVYEEFDEAIIWDGKHAHREVNYRKSGETWVEPETVADHSFRYDSSAVSVSKQAINSLSPDMVNEIIAQVRASNPELADLLIQP